MTKKIFTILSILFFCSSLVAQDYNVDWGPIYRKDGGNYSSFKLIGIEGDKYYVLGQAGSLSKIATYDLDHRLVSEDIIQFRTLRKKVILQDIIQTATGTYMYFQHLDKKKKVWSLLVSTFNNGNLGEPVEVYSQKINLPLSRLGRRYDQYQNGTAPGLLLSEDSTKVAFVNIIPGQDYRQDEEIAVAVFDSDMNLQWKSLHSFKFSKKQFEITQSIVSGNGEVYLIGWTHLKRKGTKRGSKSEAYLPQFEYKVFELRNEEIIEDIVNLGDNVAPLDVAMFFPDVSSSNYLLSGFYTDDDHKTRQKGIFFATGHPDVGILSVKLTEFEAKFLRNLVSKRAVSKGKGLDLSFDINELLRFSDGTMGFIAEKNYITYQDNYNNYNTYYGYSELYRSNYYYGNQYRNPVYHTDDIIILIFNADGEILNIQKIEKDFNGGSDLYVSYSLAKANDKVYLIFNDKKSAHEKKETKKKGSRFTDIVVINNVGNIEVHKTLFTDRELDLNFITTMSDYNQEIMLIGSQSHKRYAFGLLELD